MTGDSFTTVTSFGYKIMATIESAPLQHFRIYSGVGCLIDGLRQLVKDSLDIQAHLKTIAPMRLTPAEQDAFEKEKTCWICESPLAKTDVCVRDHDHLTGHFRGAAHAGCNINLNDKFFKLPVFFHNGKGFDFHYIAPLLPQISKRFSPISQNFEKLTCITTDTLVFRDSCLHMKTSLESWAKSTGDLPLTRAWFTEKYGASAAELMLQKGHYPYEWVTSWDRFESDSLPGPEEFCSALSGKGPLSAKAHTHATKVWGELDCKTFADYNDAYLRSDVLLLADCFEAYRKSSMKHYGLDPARYTTAPSLAWGACMRKTGAKLEPFVEGQVDMLPFAEDSRRGGMVNAITRHIVCKPEDATLYIDANNLYGWAMMQKLPVGGFLWGDVSSYEDMTPEELKAAVLAIDPDGNQGALFDVDINCPRELHDKFNALPLFPETKEGTPSTYMRQQYAAEIGPDGKRTPKVVADLKPKSNYGTDLRMLQLALQQGYVLTRVHRVLRYTQEAWMADYIDFNTVQRNACKKALDSTGSALFTLLNNSIYGKCCENVRKRSNIECVSAQNPDRADKVIAKPTLKNWESFYDNGGVMAYTAFALQTTSVTVDRPVMVGVTILELSKLLMYRAWYEVIQPQNPGVELVYMDTDSFIIYLSHAKGAAKTAVTGLPLNELRNCNARLDLGDLMDPDVLGKFKDEMGGLPIVEVVALRAKAYSVATAETKSDILKAKGIPGKATFVGSSNSLNHASYLEALTGKALPPVEYSTLASKGHQVSMRHTGSVSLAKTPRKPFTSRRTPISSEEEVIAKEWL